MKQNLSEKLQIRLTEQEKKELEKICISKNTTISSLIRELVNKEIEQHIPPMFYI